MMNLVQRLALLAAPDLRNVALLAAPDLRNVARRVAEADRLLWDALEQVENFTLRPIPEESAAEKVERARAILDGIHRDLVGRNLPNRG